MADFVARHELACFKVRVARSRVGEDRSQSPRAVGARRRLRV